MRCAICCLLVSSFAFLVVAVNLAAGEQSAGRMLTRAELEGAFGGGNVANSCCNLISECGGIGTTCDGHVETTCNAAYHVTIYEGNKRSCTGLTMMTCTESDTPYTCKTAKACIWDDDLEVCVERTGGATQTTTAPISCSPNCA